MYAFPLTRFFIRTSKLDEAFGCTFQVVLFFCFFLLFLSLRIGREKSSKIQANIQCGHPKHARLLVVS